MIIRQTCLAICLSAVLDFLAVATATPSKIRLAVRQISRTVLPNINSTRHYPDRLNNMMLIDDIAAGAAERIIMGTAIVAVILLMVIGLIIRSMVRDKKSGKSLQCGGDCSRCGGHCH